MAPIGQMARMIPGLRNHHERWAGGGYPDGLQGEEIPLMARIIAVADTFDATTTERPYQRAMTFDQARARINELAGKVLDVRVVEAFNHAYESGAFRQAPRREAPVEAVPS
jgi:HD-GYP domain-containing protein (c-di-GMP phosphodiesterase class II)